MKIRLVSVFVILIALFLLAGLTLYPATAQGDQVPRVITIYSGTTGSSFNGTGVRWYDPSAWQPPTEADVFLNLTAWDPVASEVPNTTTLVLQASADGTNWAALATLGTDVVTDTAYFTYTVNRGQFVRLSSTSAGTTPNTILLKAVLRRDLTPAR